MRREADRTTPEYVVCVPSYKRAETLKRKTLKLLSERHVPAEKIIVYVADRQEEAEYLSVLPAGSYGEIRVGVKGMGAIRNFITDDHPEGAELLMLDDDLEDVLIRVTAKKAIPLTNLDDFNRRAFEFTRKAGLRLWGIYPVRNPMFMQPTVTGDLKYIEGAYWGIRNVHTGYVKLDDKEDFERSLRRYQLDGGVVRFNFVAMVTKFYTEPGGMQEERTETRVRDSANRLVREFPTLCKLNLTKKSGHVEVRLRDVVGLGVLARARVEEDGSWTL